MHRTQQCTYIILFAFSLNLRKKNVNFPIFKKKILFILFTHSKIFNLSGSISLTISSLRIAFIDLGPVLFLLAKLYPCDPKISAKISPPTLLAAAPIVTLADADALFLAF